MSTRSSSVTKAPKQMEKEARPDGMNRSLYFTFDTLTQSVFRHRLNTATWATLCDGTYARPWRGIVALFRRSAVWVLIISKHSSNQDEGNTDQREERRSTVSHASHSSTHPHGNHERRTARERERENNGAYVVSKTKFLLMHKTARKRRDS